VDKLKPFWLDETKDKIGQNLKYDISVLKKYDVEVKRQAL
jgi:DNA polymerase-1